MMEIVITALADDCHSVLSLYVTQQRDTTSVDLPVLKGDCFVWSLLCVDQYDGDNYYSIDR